MSSDIIGASLACLVMLMDFCVITVAYSKP